MRKLSWITVATVLALSASDPAQAGGRHRRTIGAAFQLGHHHPLHSARYRYHHHRYGGYGPGYGYAFGRYRSCAPYGALGSLWHHSFHRHHSHDYYGRDYYSRESGGKAWRLLRRGRAHAALQRFSREIERDPDDAVPQVGYALAAALTGDLRKSAWGMRRAFRRDADGVRYAPVDRRVERQVRRTISEVQSDDGFHLTRTDRAFLLSALHLLIGERGAALDEVRLALEYGDRSDSANHLHELLTDRRRAARD